MPYFLELVMRVEGVYPHSWLKLQIRPMLGSAPVVIGSETNARTVDADARYVIAGEKVIICGEGILAHI